MSLPVSDIEMLIPPNLKGKSGVTVQFDVISIAKRDGAAEYELSVKDIEPCTAPERFDVQLKEALDMLVGADSSEVQGLMKIYKKHPDALPQSLAIWLAELV
jgi:hypothetical protein